MPKNLLRLHAICLIVMLQPTLLRSQETRELKPSARREDPGQQSLHYSRATVMATYDAISALALSERRTVYLALEAPMRSDLWAVHLERYLAEHPTLTTEQREVILDGMALIAAGVVEIPRAQRSQRTIEELKMLQTRAKFLLGLDAAEMALGRLGTHSGDAAVRRSPIEVHGPIDYLRNPCNCATYSDWCSFWPSEPGNACQAVACLPTDGCGIFWCCYCDGRCP